MYFFSKKFTSVSVIILSICIMLMGCTKVDDNLNKSEDISSGDNKVDNSPKTSNENKVYYENGDFDFLGNSSIIVTSIGQSADISMLDAIMKKTDAEYTLDALADVEDIKKYQTIVVAVGASSKGLGAAGISSDDELNRAKRIIDAVNEDESKKVVLTHIGGQSRRGTLSDRFIEVLFEIADYMLIVEEGNEDGIFTEYATQNNVPIALLHNISDALIPLQELFGTE